MAFLTDPPWSVFKAVDKSNFVLNRAGDSPVVMELGTPGCPQLKSTMLSSLLLLLPIVTADPNSFTMSAGLVDFRFQISNAIAYHHAMNWRDKTLIFQK